MRYLPRSSEPATRDSRQSVGRSTPNRVVKAHCRSAAARFNYKTLHALRKQVEANPEADFVGLLGPSYSKKLQSFTPVPSVPSELVNSKPVLPNNDLRSRIDAADKSFILGQLSPDLNSLLQHPDGLSAGIVHLLARSELLYESAWAASIMVFRLSDDVVVKITANKESSLIEHRTLSYLQTHQPSFPAPRPHGVVQLGHFYLLFSSFISGLTLEAAWPRLDATEKGAIRDQLEMLLTSLRQIPFPKDTQMGGVEDSGCKDSRRGTRFSTEPIRNVHQFEDFIFAGSETVSHLYTDLLRGLLPASPVACVFSHGDLRPANIMVSQAHEGPWTVVGIIDWESSGFYPEYWDAVKATNNLTTREQWDWYEFLPTQLSPRRYPTHWLIDRVWDRSMVNS